MTYLPPPPTVLVQSPSLRQVQVAAEWLANHQHKNPDLEVALNLILQGRIVPAETGELVAIAHTPSTDAFTQGDIRGIVMAKPGSLSLEGRDRQTVESLLALAQSHSCPRRVATSSQTKDWIRPLLLQYYLLEREHNPFVMICTQVPSNGGGRWALPQDKPVLQAYAEAYRAERGSGSLTQNWDDLIQRKQVAVLEYEEQIVAVETRLNGKPCHCCRDVYVPTISQTGICSSAAGFFYSRNFKGICSRKALGR